MGFTIEKQVLQHFHKSAAARCKPFLNLSHSLLSW